VWAGDGVAVLAVAPLAGQFQPTRRDVQRIQEAVTDCPGGPFEPFVPVLQLLWGFPLLGQLADDHEDAIDLVVDPVPQRCLDPADRPVLPSHFGTDRP